MSAPLVHNGLVRRIEGGRAFIAVATRGCSSCGHAGGCGIGKLAGNRRETLIDLPAEPGLTAGAAVSLELQEAQLTRAALRGYLLPAALLVAGAALGEQVGADATAALGAVIGLALGLLLARSARPLLPTLRRDFQP